MKVHSDTQCAVVDAQVARLEAELAEVRKAGKVLVKDNDRAYAANAKMAAALRAFLHAWGPFERKPNPSEHPDPSGSYLSPAGQMIPVEIAVQADAALSPDTEAWVSPEVREQVRRAIELALEHGRFDRGFVVMRLSEAKAALATLGGE